MKTFGRVLIIVIAFAILMGATYSVVSASGSTSTTTGPALQRSDADFLAGGVRPEDQDGGSNIASVMFGLLKNSVIVAFIVAVVVFLKNTGQQKRRAVPVPIK